MKSFIATIWVLSSTSTFIVFALLWINHDFDFACASVKRLIDDAFDYTTNEDKR